MKRFAPLTSHKGYSPTHSWYFYLGGPIPTLKQIQTYAQSKPHGHYIDYQISELDRMDEPKRSQKRHALVLQITNDLRNDISRYRECVRTLHKERQKEIGLDRMSRCCRDIDVSVSLKVAHIFNGFSNLHLLQDVPQQFDLFG